MRQLVYACACLVRRGRAKVSGGDALSQVKNVAAWQASLDLMKKSAR